MNLRRVAVVGTSCSGKTTFAATLAAQLRVPHIELDALHWRPGWVPAPRDAFRAAVSEAVAADCWISDGNYSAVRDLVWGRATAVIWLDYPFATVLRRALYRTARRALLREELYSGNRESFRKALLSRDSILLWVVTSYGRLWREYPELFRQAAFAHLDVMVLGGNAVARGTYDVTFTPPGATAITLAGSYLTHFEKAADAWKISGVITNLSAPPPEGLPAADTAEMEPPPDDGTMKELGAQWSRLYAAGDWAALAALYTEDAVVAFSEAPALEGEPLPASEGPWMLLLSAHSPEALRALASRWIEFLGTTSTPLPALCAAAGERRTHLEHRLAAVGGTPEEMQSRLRDFLADAPPNGWAAGSSAGHDAGKLAFVFSGQGQQWLGMGRELLAREAVFRDVLTDLDRRFLPHVGWSLLEELAASEDRSRLADTAVARQSRRNRKTTMIARIAPSTSISIEASNDSWM